MRTENQLESFGDEKDLADAASIHAIYRSLAPIRKEHKGFVSRAARESVQKIWQEARMPYPRHSHNKPGEYPWSESARDLFFAGETSNSLILEHVKPASHLSDTLFAALEDSECTDQTFLDLLVKEHRTLCFAVISRADDALLNKAGLRNALADAEGDWARYEQVGIGQSVFMALTDDPRFTPDMIHPRGRKFVLTSLKSLKGAA